MDKKTAAKGVAWNMGFAVIGKLMFPLIGILIARKVGAAAFGVFAVVSTIFAFIELFREAGLGSSYLAEPNVDAERERTYAGVALGSALVFGLLLLAASAPLSRFFESPQIGPSLAMAALCTVVSGMVAVPANRLQREARFRDVGLADFGASLVSYAAALGFAIAGFGFASLVIQMVLRVFLFSGFVLAFSKYVRPKFERACWRLLRDSMANLASNLSYFIYTTFDYLLVKKTLGDRANGAYFAAFNVASKPVDLITGPIVRTLFIAFGRAAGDRARQAGLWTRATGFLGLVTLPIYGLLGFHAITIIDILYATDFAAAGPALRTLAIYLGVRAFGSMAGSALIASGFPKYSAAAWLPGYAVAGAGIWLAWQHLTLDAIVISLTSGIVATYTCQFAFAIWKLPPSAPQMKVMLTRLGGGLVGAATVGLTRFLPVAPWLQVVVGVGAGGVVHAMTCGWVMVGDWRRAFMPSGIRDILKSI